MFNENPLVYEMFFWVGIIAMSPFLFQFSRALTRYYITSRINNFEIKILIIDEDNEEKEATLFINSKKTLSEQIKEIPEAKCYD